MLHPDQNPASVQSLSLHRELEVAIGERLFRRLIAFRLPIAAIPELYRSAAIFTLGDRPLKITVVERVVLDLDSQPFVRRIERWSSGDRP